MQKNYEIPRVEIPDLAEEDKATIEAVREEMDWHQRMSAGFLSVLLAKGKPFVGKPKPAKKPTKHQRHMANVKARSEYLKSVA